MSGNGLPKVWNGTMDPHDPQRHSYWFMRKSEGNSSQDRQSPPIESAQEWAYIFTFGMKAFEVSKRLPGWGEFDKAWPGKQPQHARARIAAGDRRRRSAWHAPRQRDSRDESGPAPADTDGKFHQRYEGRFGRRILGEC